MHTTKKSTTEDFIKKAKEIHGNKYDYSKVDYKNNSTKVCIICHEKDKLGNEHGEFWQTPANHLSGHGCPKCDGKGFTWGYYLKLCSLIHNNKYDYSKVNYINNTSKICIICPKHGEFWMTITNHLRGQGCPKCAGTKKSSTKEFIEKARKVHGDKYDYSKVEYINNKTKVCIICPEHGEFWQTPNCHLSGDGCAKCSKKHKYTTEEWIEEAKKVHGNKYDYSKVNYINSQTKVCIICPEHGEFWQKPDGHLLGQGCPICRTSVLEDKLYEKLKSKYNIERRYRPKWLGNQEIDLFLPDYNIGIECQGIQHFEPIDFFGGVDKFNYIINLDKKKNKLCKKENVDLIYFTECKVNKEKSYLGKLFFKIKDVYNYINETSNKKTNQNG